MDTAVAIFQWLMRPTLRRKPKPWRPKEPEPIRRTSFCSECWGYPSGNLFNPLTGGRYNLCTCDREPSDTPTA